MSHFIMQQIDPRDLKSTDLHEEVILRLSMGRAWTHDLEAYTVLIDGQAERAEVLYFGDRDIAGVAWGSDANWLHDVRSAEEACEREFGEST